MIKKGKYLLLLFLIISNSIALSANLFEPVAQSKAVWILNAIAGGLTGNGGGDPLLAGFLLFNGAVLAVGGILAAYTILRGTVGTAHDGEILGKKF